MHRMARRRKRDDDWIGPLAQLVGLLVLLSLISPQVRQTILAVGFLGICLLGVAVLCLIGFGIYRFATRSQGSEILQSRVAPEISLPVAPRPERVIPQNTSTLI